MPDGFRRRRFRRFGFFPFVFFNPFFFVSPFVSPFFFAPRRWGGGNPDGMEEMDEAAMMPMLCMPMPPMAQAPSMRYPATQYRDMPYTGRQSSMMPSPYSSEMSHPPRYYRHYRESSSY